jgi:quercetin dioxygenase-like cupin family protein
MGITRDIPASRPGPAGQFAGQVWWGQAAMADEEPQRLHMLKVHFAPGARSAWHSHPVGQILYVLDGVGRVQERDGPVQEIRQGDSVISGPGVWHWHGASPDAFMTHLAIQQTDPQGVEVTWGEQVEEADYRAGPANS